MALPGWHRKELGAGLLFPQRPPCPLLPPGCAALRCAGAGCDHREHVHLHGGHCGRGHAPAAAAGGARQVSAGANTSCVCGRQHCWQPVLTACLRRACAPGCPPVMECKPGRGAASAEHSCKRPRGPSFVASSWQASAPVRPPFCGASRPRRPAPTNPPTHLPTHPPTHPPARPCCRPGNFLVRNRWPSAEYIRGLAGLPILFLCSGQDEMLGAHQMRELWALHGRVRHPPPPAHAPLALALTSSFLPAPSRSLPRPPCCTLPGASSPALLRGGGQARTRLLSAAARASATPPPPRSPAGALALGGVPRCAAHGRTRGRARAVLARRGGIHRRGGCGGRIGGGLGGRGAGSGGGARQGAQGCEGGGCRGPGLKCRASRGAISTLCARHFCLGFGASTREFKHPLAPAWQCIGHASKLLPGDGLATLV